MPVLLHSCRSLGSNPLARRKVWPSASLSRGPRLCLPQVYWNFENTKIDHKNQRVLGLKSNPLDPKNQLIHTIRGTNAPHEVHCLSAPDSLSPTRWTTSAPIVTGAFAPWPVTGYVRLGISNPESLPHASYRVGNSLGQTSCTLPLHIGQCPVSEDKVLVFHKDCR